MSSIDMRFFDYPLRPSQVALRPCSPRGRARLLVQEDSGSHSHHRIIDLPQLLSAGDLLIFNDTKVIKARLHAETATRQPIECLLCQHLIARRWSVLLKPRKKTGCGDRLLFADIGTARIDAHLPDGTSVLEFSCSADALRQKCQHYGSMPLPPYIEKRRPADKHDDSDYQTIFARQSGAIAAPTAGLHFTHHLLSALKRQGIRMTTITLHVGLATFKPWHDKQTSLPAEYGIITTQTSRLINQTKQQGGAIVAVGTTTLRLVETATTQNGWIRPWQGYSHLFITPDYRFRSVHRLVTNFHLPKTSLLLLVAAFCGVQNAQRLYAQALRCGYRLYSYGDACLLSRQS